MRAIFIVDFEMFHAEQAAKIAQFRKVIPPTVPVIWTITGDDTVKPSAPDGFYASTDRLFIKPDVDASFDLAVDDKGLKLMDFVKSSPITEGHLAGGTFYGCVLGGAMDLREAGISASIMTDLTDYDRLKDYEHEEAAADWQASRVPVVQSRNILTMIRRQEWIFSPAL